ncbi:TIGR02594 family protein [Psychrobacter vallis]|uniref:TIGR02594 family protein n=1 Tax=Psychrobacter vallis TaxID=248451 RepID=UPI0019190742|nr:TIGR02594 family protein [Psychrobacter vallis]
MSKAFIEIAQAKLKQAGFYTEDIDGDFGEESLKAVQQALVKAGYVPAQVVQGSPSKAQSVAPAWVLEALKHIGLKEIVGPKHNLTILSWIKNLSGWFTDDETPWCGTFVAQCLKQAGRGYPKHWYRALAYADYGTRLAKPAYGSIGVMGRTGGGHVTFIVGETQDGKYLVGLGGNQSNAVNLMKFEKSRFTAFVWPTYEGGVASSPYPDRYNLPKYDNSLKVSTNEA